MIGSAIAEQNNSSVLSFINDLTSARSLDDLVYLLLKRQKMKELKTNDKLMKNHLLLKNEIACTDKCWRKEAASKLSLLAFEKFCSNVSASESYTVIQAQDTLVVHRIGSDAPGRSYSSETEKCKCPDRIAFMAPCAHEIARSKFLKKKLFDAKDFHLRHMARSCLEVSSVIGNYKNDLGDLEDITEENEGTSAVANDAVEEEEQDYVTESVEVGQEYDNNTALGKTTLRLLQASGLSGPHE